MVNFCQTKATDLGGGVEGGGPGDDVPRHIERGTQGKVYSEVKTMLLLLAPPTCSGHLKKLKNNCGQTELVFH